MKDKIKPSQLFYILVSYILGSTLLLSLVDNMMKQDAWLALCISFALSIPFVILFSILVKKFPGKSLMEINTLVFGNIAGNVISALYFVYIFLLLALNIEFVSGFFTGYILIETPKIIIIVFFTLTSAFAVKRGVGAIGKASLPVAVFSVGIIVITTLLLIGKMDFANFLPVFGLPTGSYVQVCYVLITVPFLDIVALMMVTSHLDGHKHITRSMLGGVAAAGAGLLCIVVRNTAALGTAASVVGNSSYEAARLIDIGEFLTRIEMLVTIGFTSCVFIKISMLYYASVNSFSQLLKLRDSKPLILPMGSVAVVVAAVLFRSSAANTDWGSRYHMFWATPFTMIFPLLTLLVAKIRRLGQVSEDKK